MRSSYVVRLAVLVPLLASGSYCAAEEVTLLGHTLTPMSNLGKGTGWDINPMVVIGGGYDSNAFLTNPAQAEGSATLLGAIGLQVSTKLTDIDQVSLNGTFSYLDYLDVEDRNAITGSAGADYTHEGEKAVTDVGFQWTRMNDPLISTGALTLRDLYVADGSVGYRSAQNLFSVGANAIYNNYLEATPGFTEQNRDSGTYTGFVQAAHEPSDEGKVYVKLIAGAIRPREDTVLNPASVFSGVVGAEGKIGARSGWNIEFGETVQHYSQDFKNDPNYNDKNVTSPIGRMGARWSWVEGSNISISGFSTLADGTSSNASRLVGAAADLRYGLPATDIALLAFGSVVQATDTGAAVGQVITNRVTTTGGAGADWLIKPSVDLLIKGNYTNSDVNVGTSWERVQVSGEIGVLF